MTAHLKLIGAMLLGALIGAGLQIMQVLVLVVVWFSYFDPTAPGVLLSRGAAWNLIQDVLTNGRTHKEVLIGLILGGVTAYMWTQREQHRRQAAWAGLLCGGLLVVILTWQHVVEAWGDWHTYTQRSTIIAAILVDMVELGVTWASGLIWWGWRLRQCNQANS